MLTGNVPNLEYSSVALQYYLRCLHYTTSRNHNDNKVKRAQSIGCDTLSRIVIHDSNMPSLFLTIEQKGSKKSSGVASAKPWIGNQDLFSVYLTYLSYLLRHMFSLIHLQIFRKYCSSTGAMPQSAGIWALVFSVTKTFRGSTISVGEEDNPA